MVQPASVSVHDVLNIVLVHGTTQSAKGFDGLVAALEERGHRAVALQVPGGAATSARGYAPLLADQVPAGFDAPVVVAHSAGGLLLPALAQVLSARHQGSGGTRLCR
jgi:alpha-beta hydrolase superfamily lysophospholipase